MTKRTGPRLWIEWLPGRTLSLRCRDADLCDEIVKRVIDAADDLASEVWTPMLEKASRLGVRYQSLGRDFGEGLVSGVSECTVNFAFEYLVWSQAGSDERAALSGAGDRSAADRLRAMDQAIEASAEKLAQLLRERAELEEESGLVVDGAASGQTLVELLARVAAEHPRYGNWNLLFGETVSEMAYTSQPGPELEDVLELLAAGAAEVYGASTSPEVVARSAAARYSLERSAATNSKASAREIVQRYFARLNGQRWTAADGSEATALDCLQQGQVRNLATLACGLRPDDDRAKALSDDAFPKTWQQYFKDRDDARILAASVNVKDRSLT